MAYTWDPEEEVFLDDNGDPVDSEQIREWIADMSNALLLLFLLRANRVLEVVAAFENPNAPTNAERRRLADALEQWNTKTRIDLKTAYYAVVAIAFGGLRNIAPEDWEVAEEKIREQIRFFDNFVSGVVQGVVALNGVFVARTGMYASSVYPTYINADRERAIAQGKKEERRVLGAADHCVDCLEQAALSWSPIGTLRRLGDSVCRSRCRCHFQYR